MLNEATYQTGTLALYVHFFCRTYGETVIKVELKAGNPYHGGVVDNLLAEWTGTPLALRVELTPDIANLPADFIVWHTSSVTAPANNTLEFSLLRNTTGTEVVNVQFPSLGITKRVVIDYPDVGTYSENDILISHPFLYASAGVYGLAAMQYAEDLQAGGMSYFKANAIQHSFWASAMASDPSIGPEYSIWFTTAHEYGNRRDGAEAFDTVMDLKNNSVGASVVCTDPSSGEIVWSMIESILLQKLTDGELWIVDEDSLLVIKSNGKKIYP